jgi:predicted RNase H-like HicB family nuclease
MREWCYLIVIEPSATGFGAYAPDVPGCVAVGDTPEETEKLLREALELHIAGLIEDGLPVPEPKSQADYVAVPIP